jgi:lipopolysaccharide/colanic/teichoic acid biosynthesis glycosyltransferase
VVKKTRLRGGVGVADVFQEKGVRGVCSVEEFHSILHKEQDRANRSQEEFSLLLFGINGTVPGCTQFDDLAERLIRRIRSTDTVGLLDGHDLGVILPYTPAVGAERLAADVCRACSVAGVAPDWRVYTYPSKWLSKGNGSRRQYCFMDILPGWGVAELSDCCASGTDGSEIGFESTACSQVAQAKPTRGAGGQVPRLLCRWHLPVWKRAMDIVVAGGGLILLSPLIFLVSVIIKSVSRGPVFFKQKRVGYLGKPFTMWKFRTMKVNCDSSNHKQYITRLINGAAENGEAFGKPMTKLDDDPRIIPFGKILRKTCLDELPQLINVIRGEMSLVGPRPAIDYEVQVYSAWHYRRLDTIPGVTGLWQVNGKNLLTFNQMVRLDIKYLKEQSFWLDVSILLKTPFAVLRQVRDGLQEKQPVAELIVENA